MKRNILISAFLLILVLSLGLIVNAKNDEKQWSKINSYIYIDKNSITKNEDTISAWFKFYNSPEHELIYKNFNNVAVYYETIKYEAYCDLDALFLMHVRAYDKNDNLLYDEINTHDVGAGCGAYIDGEIICRALCEK